jgi:hypothetical protein
MSDRLAKRNTMPAIEEEIMQCTLKGLHSNCKKGRKEERVRRMGEKGEE